jgi:hypothetical protein
MSISQIAGSGRLDSQNEHQERSSTYKAWHRLDPEASVPGDPGIVDRVERSPIGNAVVAYIIKKLQSLQMVGTSVVFENFFAAIGRQVEACPSSPTSKEG